MPLVSVIIPVYNTEKYLKKCINSVLSQSLKDIEIIIVNDGSTDNSLSIINQFTDDRIILINKANGGLSSARNCGIQKSCGEYILHVDSDDWIEPDYCLDTYNFVKKNNVDMVIIDLNILWHGFEKKRKAIEGDIEKNIITHLEYLALWSENKVAPTCVNRLIKASLYKDNNIYHPVNISLGEDLATTIRLASFAKNIGIINKSYYNYIQNTESIMNLGTIKKIYDLIYVFSILDDFFQKNNIEVNTNYLKVYHYSILISKKYDINDPFYTKAIEEYIDLMKNKNIIFPKNIQGVRFTLIKILLKMNSSKNMLNLIRIINIFFISLKIFFQKKKYKAK
ncbi:MAG TPA: glycosyltransferase family 2 protein [Arsenophonus nasoniae]|uniref:glycosyltransferase family 2 protein n=1 Tax=Arsenophonus nasoniae TaxID=638 RepID=UPI00387A0294